MAQYPYLHNLGKLKQFFGIIQTAGKPEKVTQKHLESLGLKGKGDRRIIGVLKFIGFLDSSGVPTELWQHYRNRGVSGTVLANSIRKSYSELYKLFEDAHRKDNEALRNFFSSKTSVGEKALQLIVNTFKALADMANFDSSVAHSDVTSEASANENEIPPKMRILSGPTININIQLEIPATDNPETYDLFFKAMKKHILDTERK